MVGAKSNTTETFRLDTHFQLKENGHIPEDGNWPQGLSMLRKDGNPSLERLQGRKQLMEFSIDESPTK